MIQVYRWRGFPVDFKQHHYRFLLDFDIAVLQAIGNPNNVLAVLEPPPSPGGEHPTLAASPHVKRTASEICGAYS
jgi:hypothetical protein